jgi:hypothetical protein
VTITVAQYSTAAADGVIAEESINIYVRYVQAVQAARAAGGGTHLVSRILVLKIETPS